jgi:APA family basic amino acid/polyamine antiporter
VQEPVAAPIDADRQLRRVIGPWGVGVNAVNSTIGGGIFVLPGLIAALLGPAAIVCYLICGLVIALVLTCFAEIGSFVDRSGGPIAYIEEAFGPLAGFLAWILYTIGCEAVSCAAIGNILVDMLAQIAPALAHGVPRILAFFVLYAGLAAINIRGIKQGVRLSVISTLAKLLPMFLLIAAGIFFMHWREFHWTGWPSATKLGEGSLLIFFAFQGPEEALCTSAEIRNPARAVPRGILGAIAALILLYVAIQTVCMGVLGSALALDSTAPLANAAAYIAGSPGRSLILIGAAISIFGSIAASVMAAPRSFFLMAEDGMLPRPLARVHPRFHTPYISIAVFAAITFALSVTGAFRHLAILATASILCVYLAICLGALKLRYTRDKVPGAFRAPGGPTAAILGSAAILWLLTSCGRAEFIAVGGTLALGTLYYFIRRRMLLRQRPVFAPRYPMLDEQP